MTLATPSRNAPVAPRPRASRAGALALLPAGVVAGFGLGLAALALAAPPRVVAPIPSVDAAAPAAVAGPIAAQRSSWPALFGTLPRAALEPTPVAVEPEPDAQEEDEDPLEAFDAEAPLLRGLALDDDGTGGFAMLEGEDGLVIVRVGDTLPGGYEVLDISIDGVIVDVDGEAYRIGFPDDPDSFPAASLDDDLEEFPIVARIDEGPSSYPSRSPRERDDPFEDDEDFDEEPLDDEPMDDPQDTDDSYDDDPDAPQGAMSVPFPMGISR